VDNEDTPVETVEPASQDVADAPIESTGNGVQAPVPAAHGAAISKEGVDDVLLSACIYKNPATRKSLSVHHLQRRLNELGYREAYSDKDGWYGDLTRSSIAAYQKDNGLAVDGAVGIVDSATINKLFAGDANVRIVE
jgi:peptidoglycan hydrolase-like protein with peptidoglycan-binding domain